MAIVVGATLSDNRKAAAITEPHVGVRDTKTYVTFLLGDLAGKRMYIDMSGYQNGTKKVNCTLVQALRICTGRTAHRGSRGIALPFHDDGTRRR